MVVSVTDGFRVEVRSEYLEAQSNPGENRFLFSYHVRILNRGKHPAQLLRRYWVITNAWGLKEEVRGPGVVGLQPRIKPEEHFEYTSFCPLNTPYGEMQGVYEMVWDDGRTFEVEIPKFALKSADVVPAG